MSDDRYEFPKSKKIYNKYQKLCFDKYRKQFCKNENCKLCEDDFPRMYALCKNDDFFNEVITDCRQILFDRKGCRGCGLMNYCDEKLNLNAQIPWWIVDSFYKDESISRTAWKLFGYLCRRANIDRHSPNHGRCWPRNKTIANDTGISETNLSKYVRELVKAGLIKKRTKTHINGYNDVVRSNQFIISHMVNRNYDSD